MATPFYLRGGTGDFNYCNHDIKNSSYVYAGNGYERPGLHTCIHTRRLSCFPKPQSSASLNV